MNTQKTVRCHQKQQSRWPTLCPLWTYHRSGRTSQQCGLLWQRGSLRWKSSMTGAIGPRLFWRPCQLNTRTTFVLDITPQLPLRYLPTDERVAAPAARIDKLLRGYFKTNLNFRIDSGNWFQILKSIPVGIDPSWNGIYPLSQGIGLGIEFGA